MPHFTVAIIADAHYHDARANFGDAGIHVNGTRLALRSWRDTRSGARAVNETAGVLRAALDKCVATGLRHVILAGDYTDDGQIENTRSLATLLAAYQRNHDLRFYAIPGNHDVFGPLGKHVSTRFVTGRGSTVLVTSDPDVATLSAADPGVLTPAMRCEGQPAALTPMAQFGLFRSPDDLHWESPFGLSDTPDARSYVAVSADGSTQHRLMDASYLVEPEAGLWILMLDANVFEPRAGRTDPARKKAFIDPADAGWNAVLRVKPFLLRWIRDVTQRAALEQKTLITVSHYPVLDPFQDAAGSEAALFGQTSSVRRTPHPNVGNTLAAAGLTWHAGGHLHVNATKTLPSPSGGLTDLALPSLAAYPSAFKVLHASAAEISAETILLHNVPADPAISAVYRIDGEPAPPSDFGTLLSGQFRTHVIERVVPKHWPPDLWGDLQVADCTQLLRKLTDAPEPFFKAANLDTAALAHYPAADLIVDAYAIRTAGPLARDLIPPAHLQICTAFARMFGDATAQPGRSDVDFLKRFLSVLQVSLARMAGP